MLIALVEVLDTMYVWSLEESMLLFYMLLHIVEFESVIFHAENFLIIEAYFQGK